jgi:hypothetical protein
VKRDLYEAVALDLMQLVKQSISDLYLLSPSASLNESIQIRPSMAVFGVLEAIDTAEVRFVLHTGCFFIVLSAFRKIFSYPILIL